MPPTGEDKQRSNVDWRPVPDPTVLTTQQLAVAIASLREILETRLDGMDKAIALVQVSIDRMPNMTDEKVFHLQEVTDEKFRSVEVQFVERDVRTEQMVRDSKVAVDAALQAAKEAVGKSETATIKQIDQQGTLIHTATNGLNDKIDDIKSRMTLIEGRGTGVATGWAAAVALLGVLFGIGGVIVALVRHG